MLEGLEISVLNLSEVLYDNNTKRLDSEYFKKEFLKIDSNIKSNNFKRLKYLTQKITDFGAFSQNNFIEYLHGGSHYFIRNQDIKNSFVDDDKIFISKEVYEKLSLKLEENDLLLQRTGSIGKSGIVLKKDLPSSANQNLAQVKPSKEKINSFYLNTFLNSLIGQKIFERLATGNVQPWLNLGQIESIKVPIKSNVFQTKIENLLRLSYLKIEKSRQLYTQAEKLLLQEIGLEDFIPSKESVNIKSFSESFGKTNRLDAEYYQLKYDEIIKGIQDTPEHDKLVNLVKIQKSIEPGSKHYQEDGVPFYRVTDIDKRGLSTTDKYLSEEYVSELITVYDKRNKGKSEEEKEYIVPKKETILFSKDGSIGKAYKLREDLNGITSGALLHLKVKNSRVNADYLSLVLNSFPTQMQAERDAGGSIIQHWRVHEIESVLIPIIAEEKQQQIANLIEESFTLKKQSEHLLEVAKKAVELAIEQNEEVAINYIENEKTTTA